MEFRVLQYFLTVAQEESISRAAEVLHVTQPTLSRQIAQLEEELGAELFVRGKKTVLTEAGLMLRRKAEEVAFLMDGIKMDFQSRKDLSGVIHIGSGVYAGSRALLARAGDFLERFPKVRLDVYTGTADLLKERLDHGLLDFAVLQEPIDIGSYDYIRLPEKDRWGIITSADAPWAEKAAVTEEEIRRMRLITSRRPSVMGEFNNWAKGGALQPVMTINLADNALPLVEDGTASILTLEVIMADLDPARFRFIPLAPGLTTTTVLAWKKLSPVFGPSRELLKYVRSCLGLEEGIGEGRA